MTTNKLAIIGGSGLYDINEFKEREFLKLETPWGKPSDEILKTKFNIKLDRCDFKLIRSKKATVACTHDQYKTNSIWSGIKTSMDRVLKCSDEGAIGFPSTIEGAVFSGNKAAEKLLQRRN